MKKSGRVTTMKATPAKKGMKARPAGKNGSSRYTTARVPKRVAGNVR